MKTALLTISIFINLAAAAQSNFDGQLKAIIADSANLFSKYKGDESTQAQPAHCRSFSTTMQIEGTANNRLIYIGDKTCLYETVIMDSLGPRKAKVLVDQWKKKIETAIGTGFNVSRYKGSDYHESYYQWKFSRNRFDIYVDAFPILDTKLYKVYLIFIQSN